MTYLLLGLFLMQGILVPCSSKLLCTSYADNGKTYAHEYDCSLYLQCSSGTILTRRCPAYTVFNERHGVCVYKNSQLDPCKTQKYQPVQQHYQPTDSCAPFNRYYYHSPTRFLPRDLKPLHYDIQLMPILKKLKSHFGGKVRIKFRVEKKTKRIHLNSADLSIMGRATLSSVNCSVPLVTSMDEIYGDRQVVIDLDSELTEGCEYETELRFGDSVGGRASRLVKSALEHDDEKGYILMSNMYDGQAKRLFPSFDDVGIATYRLLVGDRKGMTTVSNMPLLIDRNRMCEFVTTPPLSLDQLAFVQGHFHSMEKETAKVKVRVLTRKRDMSGLHFVLEETTVYVDIFTDYFGQPLPIKKIDYLALPGPNDKDLTLPGIIMRKEHDISVDKAKADMKIKQNAALSIAKAIAKQWTQGAMHPKSMPKSAWIQEGLAHHLSYIAVHLTHPEMEMEKGLEYTDIEKAIELEATSVSHTLNFQSRDPENYHRISRDQLTTFKGAALMRMIEGLIGHTKFKGALQKFFTHYKHKTFEMEDFKHTMVQVSGMDLIGSMMEAYSNYQGVPIIRVVMEDGNIVRVSQRDYSEDFGSQTAEVNSSYAHSFTASLPVNVITSNMHFPDNNDVHWVGPQGHVEIQLPADTSPDSWVLANKDRMGYYIVEYDVTNWNKLIGQLHRNHTVFSPVTRSQLIFDATYLFSIGHLNPTIALELFGYLVKETELGPWTSALRSLDYWRIILKGTPAETYLKSFVQHLLGDIYAKYRLGGKYLDSVKRQRQAVVVYAACTWDVYQCLEDAISVFSEVLQTGSFPVKTTADLRETIYCTGIQHSLIGAWEYVRHAFYNTDDTTEKLLLLRAMGCSPKQEIIVRYLHLSLDKRFDRSYVPHIISMTARNTCSNRLAWYYIEHKYQDLRCLFKDKPYILSDIIIEATSRFSKSFELYEIKNFLEHTQHIDQSREALEAVIALVRRRSDVIVHNYHVVADWLQTCLISLSLSIA